MINTYLYAGLPSITTSTRKMGSSEFRVSTSITDLHGSLVNKRKQTLARTLPFVVSFG